MLKFNHSITDNEQSLSSRDNFSLQSETIVVKRTRRNYHYHHHVSYLLSNWSPLWLRESDVVFAELDDISRNVVVEKKL